MRKLIAAICATLMSFGAAGSVGTASAAPMTVERPIEVTRAGAPNVQTVHDRWDRRWDRRHYRWERRHHRWDRGWHRGWDRRYYHRRWDRPYYRRWDRPYWDRPYHRRYYRSNVIYFNL